MAPLERLREAVVGRMGHHYYADKDKLLFERGRERMLARGLSSLDAYVDRLEQGDAEEWRALEDSITVGETYFFRYPDHFEALRKDVLPRLIAARRDVKQLRIWSVGCSNGAEPYSVAIVLRELLGAEIDSWRISLVGGDLSQKALTAARGGNFNDWALRTMGPEDRAQYFDRNDGRWLLKREYRSMVRFERQNILDLISPTPPLEWTGYDLILCRNVLIYFSPENAVKISMALADALAPDGVLVLGHAEATLASSPFLLQAASQPLPSEFATALQPTPPPAAYMPPVIPDLPPSMCPRATPVLAPRVGNAGNETIERLQALADAGAYEEAELLCRTLIDIDPMSARLHYLNAILRQVADDPKGAEAALKRAVYLDRSFVLAHHRMGMLLLELGRVREGRRSLQVAARLAKVSPRDDLLPEGQGVSAGALLDAVRQQLADLEEAS